MKISTYDEFHRLGLDAIWSAIDDAVPTSGWNFAGAHAHVEGETVVRVSLSFEVGRRKCGRFKLHGVLVQAAAATGIRELYWNTHDGSGWSGGPSSQSFQFSWWYE